MIRTIIWFIYFWISLILSIPATLKVKRYDKLGETDKRDALVNAKVQKWAKSLIDLSGCKVTVSGLEHIPSDRSVLFVSNHQSNFDIPLLLGFIDRPKAFIAKIELGKIPMVSTWMGSMKCVFMDRNDMRQSAKAIRQGINTLKSGYNMVIFPEGTRSADGMISEFKPGALKLATKSGVPIVPVTIKGSHKIMKKGSMLIRPAEVELIISPMVSPESMEGKDTVQLTEEVKSIVEGHL